MIFMKKKKFFEVEFVVLVVALSVILVIMSRCIPDGTTRLNIGKSHVGEKAIALTFDDGPSGHTEMLLDGLNQYNAKATFFVIGSKAEKNPDLVMRAADEGHLIGNHTYSHPRLTLESPAKAKEDIGKCSEVIKSITGSKPFFVRVPYGDVTAYQLKYLDTFFVSWSDNIFDWDEDSEQVIYERIMKKAEDGAIMLLHDTNEVTVKAVLRAIPDLQAQGYEFVRVDDLLTRDGDKLAKGIQYRKCENDKSPVAY